MSYLNTVRRPKGGRIAVTAGVLAAGVVAAMMGPVFSLATAGQAVAADAGSYEEQVLAKNGDNAIDPALGRFYRIPALADLGGGVVLASYDGRPDGADAPSANSIVQRRSIDGGNTWGAPTYIARGQEAKNGNKKFGFSDPSYVVDKVTGDVFNFHVYSKDVGFQGSGFGNDDADRNIIGTEVSVSKDKGLSWSTDPANMPVLPPADYAAGSKFADFDGPLITDVVKPVGDPTNVGGVSGVFAASGEGIQLQYGEHKGRLIQQFTGKVKQADGSVPYQAYSVYSDDHGATWERGEFTGTGMDENKTVELSNGDVMLNSRASSGGNGGRKVAISKDGGQSYGPVTIDATLTDPVNNASITRMYPNAAQDSAEAKMLLFSNANSSSGRQNGTIRYSCNDGTSWSAGKQFKAGAMSYSTATALSDGTFGVFYEGDSNTMTFGKFDAAWLGVDCENSMTAVLSAAPVSGANGASVSAQLTVTNNGTETLSGATASFAAKAGWNFDSVVVPDVAPDATVTVEVPLTIPEYAKAGNINLSASLSLGDQTVAATVPVTITGGATKNIVGLDIKGSATDIARDLGADPYVVGSKVPYTFVVSSLSNVAVNAVPLTGNFDPLVPADRGGATNAGNCRFNNLAVSGNFSCTTPRHQVTAEELANGFFVPLTTWEATATGATTQNYTVTGAEVDLLLRKPAVSVEYTAGALIDVDESGFATVGDTITYTGHVANTGNVKLTNIAVPGQAGFDLDIAASKTLTRVYTLTAADVAANKVAAKDLSAIAYNGKKAVSASSSAPVVKACADELCGEEPPMENLIPQGEISIESVSSEELTGETAPSGPAAALLDGDVESFWHTKWSGTPDDFPHSVVFDLGKEYQVTGFEYTQRQNGANGRIKEYEIHVSESPTEFGTKVASGTFAAVNESQRITIGGNKVGRYVKLVGLNSIAGNEFAGGAEANIGGLVTSDETASIAATPGTVEAGKDVSLALSGFPASSEVELAMEGGVALGNVTTDASGNATQAVTVPVDTAAGNYAVTAVSGATNATVTLVVTAAPTTGGPVVGAIIAGERADGSRDLAANPYSVGQQLPYNFVVKSTADIVSTVYPTAGDFTGFNISGTPNCRYRDIPVGGGYTCTTAKRVVTAEDVANGFFQPVTKWAAEGTGATTVDYTIDGGEVDVLVREPSLALAIGTGVLEDKDDDGYASVEDIVSFPVTAENDGNVALTDVALPGVDGAAATLAAGASTAGTIEHTVTVGDLAAGQVAGVSVSVAAKNGAKDVSKDATGTALELTLAPEPTTEPTSEPTATSGPDEATGAVNVGTVAAGEAVTITGENFKPGTTATFTLDSDPVVLGSAIVAANGTVSLTARVPADVRAGEHTVVISGTGVDGEAVEVSIPLTVVAAGSSPSAGTTPSASATAGASQPATSPPAGIDGAGSGDDLANTGASMLPFGLAGGMLVLLGGLILMRRSSVRSARH